MKPCYFLFACLCFCLLSFSNDVGPNASSKINGVNFTAPVRKPATNPFNPVLEAQANWTSVVPYAYGRPGRPAVNFDQGWQWWGETSRGTRETIRQAKAKGLKVMVKPHVWIMGQGWAGDFACKTVEDWEIWERDYEAYILTFAKMAEEEGAEMFCIGTEYRKAVIHRSPYWRDLIRKVRRVYSGKLTYAANWDNYEKVTFWDQLDYIGIDAYFPLSNDQTPTTKTLLTAWKPYAKRLQKLHDRTGKPVLFTEYGYCSADYTARQPWSEGGDRALNFQGQIHAYEALYQIFWEKEWMAGGFIWKWFEYHEQAGGAKHRGYTPQNKPVIKTIQKWYGGRKF